MTDTRPNEQIIAEAWHGQLWGGCLDRERIDRVVAALAAAGRLVTPEHEQRVTALVDAIKGANARYDLSVFEDPSFSVATEMYIHLARVEWIVRGGAA